MMEIHEQDARKENEDPSGVCNRSLERFGTRLIHGDRLMRIVEMKWRDKMDEMDV